MTVTIREKLENLAVSASNDFAWWAGLDISPEKFLEIVDADPAALEYLTQEVDYPGAYETKSEYGLDTCVRDAVFDAVARYATGRSWPVNAEGAEVMEEFRVALSNVFPKSEPNGD